MIEGLFPSLSFITAVLALPQINNGVKGPPIVTCGVRQIKVEFEILEPFNGNLYTKGYFHKKECRLQGGKLNTTLEMILPVDSDCGIRRKRMSNPKGLILDTTVVLMFHPIFLTQTDKSYHVQCQYLEVQKTVTNNIDVSMLPPTELPQNMEQQDAESSPICRYEVLSGTSSGSPLTFATVGDAVYHKWSCGGGKDNTRYCMTVHSCTADDGQGMGQQLIDSHGCTLDTFLLQPLEYSDDLTAGQISHVFKFADRPTIFFSCMIRIQMKDNSSAVCPRPTEVCDKKRLNGTVAVETPNRVADGKIPSGFPRPPDALQVPDSDYFIDEPTSSEEKMESGDKAPLDFDSNFKPAISSRLIRREISRYLMDVDVSAPSVDVIDLPETDVRKPLESVGKQKKVQNDICVSRFSIFLSVCILCFVSVATVLLFCIVQRRFFGRVGFEPTHPYEYQNAQRPRTRGKQSLESGALDHSAIRAGRSSRKNPFPHPDYGLTIDR
ncbi:unnamed protein product [Caenorhabditis auriculariae]|uniref:ZP domain-containing protein n=1 Tax=Caenorhabditis auriculariae TaxID=2777116 RepID=A0A8S1GTA6_9PELO|nr:unnamed protein product [Caenorhabditis auriculariae]